MQNRGCRRKSLIEMERAKGFEPSEFVSSATRRRVIGGTGAEKVGFPESVAADSHSPRFHSLFDWSDELLQFDKCLLELPDRRRLLRADLHPLWIVAVVFCWSNGLLLRRGFPFFNWAVRRNGGGIVLTQFDVVVWRKHA